MVVSVRKEWVYDSPGGFSKNKGGKGKFLLGLKIARFPIGLHPLNILSIIHTL